MKTVEIKKGKSSYLGTLHRGVLCLPKDIGESISEISFDNKTYKVLEERVDDRDDLIYLTLELPNGSKKEGSNDKSNEGSSTA